MGYSKNYRCWTACTWHWRLSGAAVEPKLFQLAQALSAVPNATAASLRQTTG